MSDVTSAVKMVFAGKFDPFTFRDCTEGDILTRIRLGARFERDRHMDFVHAGGLTDSLLDLRSERPEVAEMVDDALSQLRDLPRRGAFVPAAPVREWCQNFLLALELEEL